MTDSEAIRLFVAEGNPREDWWALDERDRYPWRKKALEVAKPREDLSAVAGFYLSKTVCKQ